jgi:tetratricopeptide (TPR) repeat protein
MNISPSEELRLLVSLRDKRQITVETFDRSLARLVEQHPDLPTPPPLAADGDEGTAVTFPSLSSLALSPSSEPSSLVLAVDAGAARSVGTKAAKVEAAEPAAPAPEADEGAADADPDMSTKVPTHTPSPGAEGEGKKPMTLPLIIANGASELSTAAPLVFGWSEAGGATRVLASTRVSPSTTTLTVPKYLALAEPLDKELLPWLGVEASAVEVGRLGEPTILVGGTGISVISALATQWGEYVRLAADAAAPSAVVAWPVSASAESLLWATAAAAAGGCRVDRVVSESAALAAAYVAKHQAAAGEEEATKNVLFVDVGHVATTVTLAAVSLGEGSARIVRAVSSTDASGVHIDVGLSKLLATRWSTQHPKEKPTSSLKKRLKILKSVTKAKHLLSTVPEAVVAVDSLLCDGEADASGTLSRADLEAATTPILTLLSTLIPQVVGEEKVDTLELLGGTTRSPLVRAHISTLLGDAFDLDKVGHTMDQLSAVAMGAALLGTEAGASLVDDDLAFTASAANALTRVQEAASETGEALAHLTALEQQFRQADEQVRRYDNARDELERWILRWRGTATGANTEVPAGIRAAVVPIKGAVEELANSVEGWFYDQETPEVPTNADVESFAAKLAEARASLEELGGESLAKARADARAAREAEAEAMRVAQEEAEQRAAEGRLDDEAEEKDPYRLPKKRRIEIGEKRKAQGNARVKELDYVSAVKSYVDGLRHVEGMLDLTDADRAIVDPLKVSLYSNLSMCYLKLESYKKARENASGAIKLDGAHAKALYRRGLANVQLKEFDDAHADFTAALAADPTNKDAARQLKRVDAFIVNRTKKEKQMYGKMFGA